MSKARLLGGTDIITSRLEIDSGTFDENDYILLYDVSDLALKKTRVKNAGLQGPQGLQGPAGPAGLPGIKGDTGLQGPAGPAGLQGIKGDTGLQGPAGPVGPQGTSIVLKGSLPTSADLPSTGNSINDAYIVESDGQLYVWDGVSWNNVGSIVGPAGPAGAPGAPGATGPQGPQGPTGPAGPQGTSGAQGATGTPGSTGPQGATGVQGTTGAQGATGLQGFRGLQGERGLQGVQGTTGIQGQTGIQGPQGSPLRIKGTVDTTADLPVTDNVFNDAYVVLADSFLYIWSGVSWDAITPFIGPAGPQGPSGLQGPAGPQGVQGPAGSGASSGLIATDDSTTVTLYPVMVANAGIEQLAKVTTTKLYFNSVSGALSATDFNSLSDQESKTDVQTIENSLEKLLQIRGVQFKWLETGDDSLGVIAQEVETVFPEIVKKTPDGVKTVGYNGLIAVLIEAVKTLNDRINQLPK